MDQRIIDLYDEFTHVTLDRRLFLERLAELVGGMSAALALVPLLQADKAAAAEVAPGDPRLAASMTSFPGASGEVKAYLARPAGSGTVPGVVVIHENRGLSPHIQDIARRFAVAGFAALAPDLLSPLGGTPENEDTAREMTGKLDAQMSARDSQAAVDWLRDMPESSRRVATVGFCWGGGVAGQLATMDEDLDAVVVFYGRPPAPEQAARIKAPLLLHFAGLDERINAAVPAFRDALDKAGARYSLYMYEGANHAFLNETSQARYHPEAAKLAWQRTLDFLRSTLRQA